MKTKKKIELNVDFIGGEKPLTEKEKKEISDFIRKSKMRKRSRTKKTEKIQ